MSTMGYGFETLAYWDAFTEGNLRWAVSCGWTLRKVVYLWLLK